MTDKTVTLKTPAGNFDYPVLDGIGRSRSRRYPQALRPDRDVHLRSRASRRPRAARARSPTSTAKRASCSTAAIRSTSSPRTRPSWRSPTCCSTASCRTKDELDEFTYTISRHTMVHEQLATFYRGFRRDAHPMAIMCGVVGALSAFYHDSTDITDPRAADDRLAPADRQDADAGRDGVQIYARPAVPLSAEQPQLHRQFPAHDLRRPGRAL